MNSLDLLFTSLEDRGWAWGDDLLPQELPAELMAECQKQWQDHRFHPAHIGRDSAKALRPDIRGDSICWLEPTSQTVQSFLQWTLALRQSLNQRYYLGLNSDEFHFARYPAGTGYQKHLDQPRGPSPRKISLVLYLNPEWSSQNGGELVIYSPQDPETRMATVLPAPGRLVLFRSDVIPHEVLPCFQTRWSLTGWFRAEVQSLS
jgi:SM-20-related protein